MLRAAGIEFEVVPSGADENIVEPDPEQYCLELARLKAGSVFALYPNRCVLGADTVVYLDRIINKPADRADAINILTALSGRIHSVYTGVWLAYPGGGEGGVSVSRVKFPALSAGFIENYIDQYQPFDKAGAYGFQELKTLADVTVIEGDEDNVIGLPVALVKNLLYKTGGERP